IIYGEIDRLVLTVSIRAFAVRQEAVVTVGPERKIDGVQSFFRSGLHHGPPASRDGLLEQGGQDFFKRLPLQMIEQDFRFDLSRLPYPDRTLMMSRSPEIA